MKKRNKAVTLNYTPSVDWVSLEINPARVVPVTGRRPRLKFEDQVNYLIDRGLIEKIFTKRPWIYWRELPFTRGRFAVLKPIKK